MTEPQTDPLDTLVAIKAPDSLSGEQLTAEIEQAGLADVTFTLRDGMLYFEGTDDAKALATVVAKHSPKAITDPITEELQGVLTLLSKKTPPMETITKALTALVDAELQRRVP